MALHSFCQTVNLPLKPAKNKYFFKEVKFTSGEPIRDVRDMLQDKRGFIWLASDHGLIRYDGHDFRVFRHKPNDNASIVDTETRTLHMLGDTLLCVGTARGISLIDIRIEKFINIENDDKGNKVHFIQGFYLDDNGKIWIGALDGLYSLKSDFSGVVKHTFNMPPIRRGNVAFAKTVHCITQNSIDKNLLMLGTESGLISFDIKRNTLCKSYPNTEATYYRSEHAVYNFIVDGKYLWTLSWYSGINRFDMVNEKWDNFEYPDGKGGSYLILISMLMKNKDEMFTCDTDRGFGIFNKKTGKNTFIYDSLPQSVLRNWYMRIFMQNDSTLWLANDDGLWMQNRKANIFRVLNVPYQHTWVMPSMYDQATSEYYLGMVHKSYGVGSWNSTTKKWKFLQTETEKDVELNTYAIIKDSKGVIWMGIGRRGLWYVDKKNNLLKKFLLPDGKPLEIDSKTVFKLFEDSKKNIWIGTGDYGVVRLNPERTQATYYKNIPDDSASLFAGTHIRAIEEDKYGRIWIGNHNGFCTFNPETEKFSQEIAKKLYKTGIKRKFPQKNA